MLNPSIKCNANKCSTAWTNLRMKTFQTALSKICALHFNYNHISHFRRFSWNNNLFNLSCLTYIFFFIACNCTTIGSTCFLVVCCTVKKYNLVKFTLCKTTMSKVSVFLNPNRCIEFTDVTIESICRVKCWGLLSLPPKYRYYKRGALESPRKICQHYIFLNFCFETN